MVPQNFKFISNEQLHRLAAFFHVNLGLPIARHILSSSLPFLIINLTGSNTSQPASNRMYYRLDDSSLHYNGHFSRWTWVSRYQILLELWTMEEAVTTGATGRTKVRSNRHHQQTNTQLITGWVPFLSSNQHYQSTEGLYRLFSIENEMGSTEPVTALMTSPTFCL